MSAFDLLVHLRETRGEPLAARAAFALARRLDAYLYGLHVAPLDTVAFSTPETVVFQVHEADRLYADAQARDSWWRDLLSAHAACGEWLVAQGDAVEAMCHCARWCDFVVAERPTLNPDAPTGWGTVSRTVFGAGIPVLVVPEAARLESLGERILVAWNHSREAMLAIRGAMPLLERAAHVVVLDGAPQTDELGTRHLPQLDLTSWLGRHNVRAEIHAFAPKNDFGAAILAEARAMQADMIVMGAWGHSRIAQLVLGGSTRYLFQNSDLPLLVAH
ncbi:MAG: universal stress protein [Xanthomonadales bacterium PRO7]|nr:universal stress protein [Xanthomonadales bacterium PRO7]